MKRKLLSALLALSLLLSLCACGAQNGAADAEGQSNKSLTVVTTLFPAYDFAREICAGRCEIVLLVPPGAEAHSYEPTPQDLVRIGRCDLLICNGGESEAWLETLLDGAEGGYAVLRMLDCVDALEEEHKEGMQRIREEESEEDGAEYDEHVWTSPRNAAAICRAICGELCALDPEGAETYRRGCESYCEKLDELDAAFRDIAAQAHGSCLIFADRFPARYFVEEYGLDYYAAFPGCADDTEPSARTVAFLIDRVRAEHTPAVLYIEYSNQKMADVICEDTGCEKLLFHTCHTVSAEDLKNGATYLSLMWANTESVKEALG
ncbi:MAG: zinc ABC transporter substrate-binding protein [Oscillospiraceae bacterium]|nr:zinc ABC transporter substrate-binding protein [Oscillospiraceae bacterium]